MDESAPLRPLAVVTGASSGIGLELARLFADDGFDLIVAAEDDAIMHAGQELATDEVAVQAVQVDLATPDGVEELYRHISGDGRAVAALALNAGVGAGGAFATDTALEDELRVIDLNVRSTVHLAKLVVRDMLAVDAGRILMTSSIGATMPGTYHAVYNASKSFVQSFALAVREELKDTGVTVTVLLPGPTDTEFFERAGLEDTRVGTTSTKDDPAKVAKAGFEALMDGDERAVASSLSTKLQGHGSRFLPDSAKAKMHAKMAEPGTGKDA